MLYFCIIIWIVSSIAYWKYNKNDLDIINNIIFSILFPVSILGDLLFSIDTTTSTVRQQILNWIIQEEWDKIRKRKQTLQEGISNFMKRSNKFVEDTR